MSKKLTQKDIIGQFFKYCTRYGESRVRYEEGRLFVEVNGMVMVQVADLNVESLETGLSRTAKNCIDARLYELRDTAKTQQELEAALQEVSDLLASQGLSVDKDYGSDSKGMEGG
jgi:hypothetical protein